MASRLLGSRRARTLARLEQATAVHRPAPAPVRSAAHRSLLEWRDEGAARALDASPSTRFADVPRRSLGIAFLFWAPPFGLLGCHKLYLGRPVAGLVYALTLGLLGTGWLLDLVTLPYQVREANLRTWRRWSRLR